MSAPTHGSHNPLVLVEVADRIATLTLNRPEARNALNRALMYALWDAVGAVGSDRDVDAVIVTGADPAFCAGVDLKEMSGESPRSAEPRDVGQGPERDTNGLFRFLPVIDKPVIGAINGVAVTGGLEIALQCTFSVASERARFADTHARLGVMPGGGITVLLTQSVGLRRAVRALPDGQLPHGRGRASIWSGQPCRGARRPTAVHPPPGRGHRAQRPTEHSPPTSALPPTGQRRHARRSPPPGGLHGRDVAAGPDSCRGAP